MNPKAMPRTQLLGQIDMDTREWTDGVLTYSARQVVKEPQGKQELQWAVFLVKYKFVTESETSNEVHLSVFAPLKKYSLIGNGSGKPFLKHCQRYLL